MKTQKKTPKNSKREPMDAYMTLQICCLYKFHINSILIRWSIGIFQEFTEFSMQLIK